MVRRKRLPSGNRCFRCYIPFVSTTCGKKHGVSGKVFWKKYKAFYSRSNYELDKDSDLLCSACYAHINQANGPGEEGKLQFIRWRKKQPAVPEIKHEADSDCQRISEGNNEGNILRDISVASPLLPADFYVECNYGEDRTDDNHSAQQNQHIPGIPVSNIMTAPDTEEEKMEDDDISVAVPLLPPDLCMEEDDNDDNHPGQQNQHIPGIPVSNIMTAPDTEEENMEDDGIETGGIADINMQYISVMAPNKEYRAKLLRNFAKDRSFNRSSDKDTPTASNCSKSPQTVTRTTPQTDEIVNDDGELPSDVQVSGVEEQALAETQTGESLPRCNIRTDANDMCHLLSRKFADGSILNTNFATTQTPECPCQDLTATPKLSASHYVLHMWRIRHYKQGHVLNPAIPAVACGSIAALSKLLTFLHSPDCIISDEDLCLLIPMEGCRLVNPFVSGLFFLHGLLQLSPDEMDLFRSEVSKMSNCRYKDLVLTGLENSTDRYTMVMSIYHAILLHEWDWDKPFGLDGDEEDNFNGVEKRHFYFWLYSLYASNSHASVLVLHLLMEDMIPTSWDADGLIIYKGVTPEDLRHTARVHSLVLQLRQDSSWEEYERNVMDSETSLRTFPVEPRHMKAFINMLYRGADVVDDTMAELPLKVLMDLSNTFKIKDPINLAFGNAISLPDTPMKLQICMDLFDFGGDVHWIEPILRHPSRYLTADNIKYLRVAQMRELLMSDNLELNELDVYKLVLEYCHADSITADIGTYPTTETRLACLLPTVRFATMPTNDFNYVMEHSHLDPTDRLLFSGAVNHPEISAIARFPDKYHKPNIPRHSANPH